MDKIGFRKACGAAAWEIIGTELLHGSVFNILMVRFRAHML